MKKRNIVKSKDDFTRIINKKNGSVNKYFIINKETNNDLIPKFGITFVKNMCNAVNRNKLKRQIKSIIDNNKNIYENNKNYIIIIRKDALNKSYKELEDNLISLFNKLKEKKDEREKESIYFNTYGIYVMWMYKSIKR